MEQYLKDFAESGGLVSMSIVLIVGLVIIFVGHMSALKNLEIELKEINESAARNTSYKQINIICFISLFVFDWMYPWAFEFFGKKRIVYPVLLSVIATAIGAISIDDLSGDTAEFLFFGLVPLYFIVHCLGWLHVNLVYYRLDKVLNKY